MAKIFIVDDDPDILFTLGFWLKKKGYEVWTFADTHGVVDTILLKNPDLIIIDVNLRGEDGRQLCKEVKRLAMYKVSVILFSANPSGLENYQDNCADDILHKPFEFGEMEKKVKQYAG